MKKQAFLLVLFAMLISLPLAAQEGRFVSVPVKGTLNAAGPVELLITFYDRAAGGRELYSVTRTLNVADNIYFDMVDVPESALRGRLKAFIEVAHADTPAIPIGERQQFARRSSPNRAVSIQGCSLCFTCGGTFSVFQGAWNTAASPAIQERGNSCSGAVSNRTDTRPFLCCQ
ncbi:MAG TPA: hypothetical protein VF756_23025 [Thermoanaerobaculia bacterium]